MNEECSECKTEFDPEEGDNRSQQECDHDGCWRVFHAECGHECEVCGKWFCRFHINQCEDEDCNQDVCPMCLTDCPYCGEKICKQCTKDHVSDCFRKNYHKPCWMCGAIGTVRLVMKKKNHQYFECINEECRITWV